MSRSSPNPCRNSTDRSSTAWPRSRSTACGTTARLRYAQDIAWRHSEHLGFDRRWYTQRGRWWVVRSVELTVLAPIPMGRTLRLSTVVVGHRRIWARRLSECRLADGTAVGT